MRRMVWGHVVAPLYCLLWFPQGTFYTIRQHTTFGSSSWSKIKYPGSHEPRAVGCHGHHFSLRDTGDRKTGTRGQPGAGGGGGREWARYTDGRTDDFYLQEGVGIYVTWSQRQARRPVLSRWRRKGAGSRQRRLLWEGRSPSAGSPAFVSQLGVSSLRASLLRWGGRPGSCPPATPGASGEARKQTGFLQKRSGGCLALGGSWLPTQQAPGGAAQPRKLRPDAHTRVKFVDVNDLPPVQTRTRGLRAEQRALLPPGPGGEQQPPRPWGQGPIGGGTDGDRQTRDGLRPLLPPPWGLSSTPGQGRTHTCVSLGMSPQARRGGQE